MTQAGIRNSTKKILYAEANYDNEEIEAVVNILKNSHLSLMSGKKVNELESKVSKLYNKELGLMVNSSSSANLLDLLSLRD